MAIAGTGEKMILTFPISGPDGYIDAIGKGLERLGLAKIFGEYSKVIVKPNIVNDSPPPVTTDVDCVKALVKLLRENVDVPIFVADGSGEGDTIENMVRNGYENVGAELLDLDACPVKKYEDPRAVLLKEIYLPECLEGAAIISVPSAKDHSMTTVTLGLKNMIGCLPASRYGGYWSYKKSRLHMKDIDQAAADLILYLEPHVTVIDARLGLKGGHLWGTIPDPPLGRVIMGQDVLSVDRAGAELLGHNPDKIRHLVKAGSLRQ